MSFDLFNHGFRHIRYLKRNETFVSNTVNVDDIPTTTMPLSLHNHSNNKNSKENSDKSDKNYCTMFVDAKEDVDNIF